MNNWPTDRPGVLADTPAPQRFDRIVLHRHGGCTVSLHRFAGRWVILRVAEAPDGDGLLESAVGDLDAVVLNVVAGPVNGAVPGRERIAEVVYDADGHLAERFPSLTWPSTFVVDPDGQLSAILSDQAFGPFLAELVRRERAHDPSGAIDRRDLQQ